MTKRSIHRCGIALLATADLVVCATSFYVYFHRPPATVLRDGTRLSLTDAKIGVVNGFQHGPAIEKLLGRLFSNISSNLLRRSTKQTFGWGTATTSLTMEFQLTGPTNLLELSELSDRAPSPFFRNWRVRHWGEDDYPFTEEVNMPLLKKYSDGYFAYVTTTAFSRTSRTLHIQFEQRKTETAPWTVAAAFDFPNPNPVTAKKWTVQNYPVKIENGPLTAVLQQVQVQQPREHAAPYHLDIWQHAFLFPFKFYLNSALTTNWTVKELNITDATGNNCSFRVLPFVTVTNGWTLVRESRSPLPTVPWRCQGRFSRRTDILALEIPVLSFPLAAPITTNLAGVAVTIVFDQDDTLAVTIPSDVSDHRVTFGAYDQQGRPVSDDSSVISEDQRECRRKLRLDNASAIQLEIALVPLDPEIEFDITIQPALVPEIIEP